MANIKTGKAQKKDVENGKAQSLQDFTKFVQPLIERHYGGKVLLDQELGEDGKVYESEYGYAFDNYAGKDGIIVVKHGQGGGHVLSFAQRMRRLKPGQPLYNSFTLREAKASSWDTELGKLVENYENGFDRPQITIQAYSLNGILLSVGIVKTDDLAKFAIEKIVRGGDKPSPETWQRRFIPGVCFLAIPFDYLIRNGVPVTILTPAPVGEEETETAA
ncbi:MAG: hypothetical protein ACYDBP_06610 [Leptospirales bacterium]